MEDEAVPAARFAAAARALKTAQGERLKERCHDKAKLCPDTIPRLIADGGLIHTPTKTGG
jgi:hypothetical protein